MKTEILHEDRQNIFFTSDLHLNHERVIEYCNRPFSNVIEMNRTIVDNWNKVVDTGDIVFVLGDFSFGNQKTWLYFIEQLEGFIYLIKGNHDKSIPKENTNLNNKFKWIDGFLNTRIIDTEFDGNEQRVTLCHYPMLSWYHSHKGAWQLFGHIHSNDYNKLLHTKESPFKTSQYDVGIDNNNFTPVHWNEIKSILTKQIRS